MNVTPDWITELKDNEIFVFGSNTAGRHGRGAAKQALGFGATMGQGFGISGRTFAIPTMRPTGSGLRTCSIEQISAYVKGFIDFAKLHPKLVFLITEIGCGLAGLDPKDIAPLFLDCLNLENVCLPKAFHRILQHMNVRGI
jgi:hypothetical protein